MKVLLDVQLDLGVYCTKCGSELKGRTLSTEQAIEVDPCVTCLKGYQLNKNADNDSAGSGDPAL